MKPTPCRPRPRHGRTLSPVFLTALAAALLLLAVAPTRAQEAPGPVHAEPPIVAGTMPAATGSAGLGFVMRFEGSPYRGGDTRNDLVPVYLFEGRHAFIETYRAGLKFIDTSDRRFDAFVAYRFEGHPYDRVPASLAGMANRGPGVDAGVSYQLRTRWGTWFAEGLHDIAGGSNGTELRAGVRMDTSIGRLHLQPQFALSRRDSNLNNYYYGVRPDEATAVRPAWSPGGGTNVELGLAASYRLSERWRLIGNLSATRWAEGVRMSPIVENRTQLAGQLGLAYDFSPDHEAWPEGRPLIVKVLHGKSTDCDLAKVMLLRCFSTDTVDQTRVSSVELGRPFIEHLNGWPLDFVGYVGLLHHDERGLQDDGWQANAYMKGYWYGFPWSERVRTRVGFGAGVSYAQRVPYVEARDQIARGRSSSRLLNYLDPSIDVSVGDLIGYRPLREAYLGLGVSHRSGIFGTSRLLGNVNGGSNYIYSYLEWRM